MDYFQFKVGFIGIFLNITSNRNLIEHLIIVKIRYNPIKKYKKHNLVECIQLAKTRNGKCLSTEYKNNSKLLWECNKGHQWSESLKLILRGLKYNRWCRQCRKIRFSIEDCHALAKSRGGKCLSEEYSYTSKLLWECNKGHQWKTNFNSIKAGGSWCFKCYNHTVTIDRFIEIAKKKEGICLSTVYKDNQSRMTFQCKFGHIWTTSAMKVSRGSWCHQCAHLGRRLTLEDCQEYAKSQGGECLSKEYINVLTKMDWKCKFGHIWPSIFSAKRETKTWCPSCHNGKLKGETVCRKAMEYIFNVKFEKDRPAWLISPKSKRRLELDGVNHELKVAFEYNGIQHYKFLKVFHKTEESFKYQLYKDKVKVRKCKKNGYTLIVIHQQGDRLQEEPIFEIILEQLKLLNPALYASISSKTEKQT